MKDERLIDKLDKCVVFIEDQDMYAINKHHTLLIRFKLQETYPKMCFATSNWINGSDFYRDAEGNLKIREKTIVLRKEGKTITIPQLDINLKEEYNTLLNEKMEQLFTLDERFFETALAKPRRRRPATARDFKERLMALERELRA